MELRELHVHDLRAGFIGQGDAIPRGDRRVRRGAVHPRGAPGGEDDDWSHIDLMTALFMEEDLHAARVTPLRDDTRRKGMLEHGPAVCRKSGVGRRLLFSRA